MVFAVDIASSVAMSKSEAEEITLAIQQNFDSLGLMLETARNRKAWKALNYKDFGSYCDNEFGKAQRRSYQLIEEAKIAQTLKEEGGRDLRLPVSSNLRLLKNLPVELQIEAIKYSEELASAADQKKPNKNHLLFAINKVSGSHSTEDLKSSLEALGFTKGVEVATLCGVNIGRRGFVQKLDKKGRLHVELHSCGRVTIDYDVAELRILSASEKPEKAASFDSTNIGDKVLIFSPGLDGILGTIQTRLNDDKMVGIKINGNLFKLPYAELEVVEVEVDESEQESWSQNFIWTDFGVQWCYDSESQTIATVYQDLKLHPTEKGKGSPADWVRRWVRNNALNLAVELLPEEQLSSVITTRLITCGGEEEKGNLAESLIAEIWKMSLPSECRERLKILIAGKVGKARGISFGRTVPELLSGKKNQTRRVWQDDYARSFLRYYEEGIGIPALDKGQHRGGQEIGKIHLTEKPYQQMLSEMPASDLEKEGGMCTTVQEFTDRFFEGQDKLVWVLNFEFFASESTGEIALLRDRLEEAEQVIIQLVKSSRHQSVIDVATVNAVDNVNTVLDIKLDTVVDMGHQQIQLLPEAKECAEFLVENTASIPSPAEDEKSWLSVLESNGFTQIRIRLDEEPTETYRGWDIHEYNSSLVDISHPSKGIFSTDLPWPIVEPYEWLKNIINQVEDFCPGQLSLFPIVETAPDAIFTTGEIEIEEKLPPEILERLEIERSKATDLIYDNEFKKKHPTATGKHLKKQLEQLDKSTASQQAKLEELDRFSEFRVGQTICHKRDPLILGKIIRLEFSQGGMPSLGVKYFKNGELGTQVSELVSMIFQVDV